MKKNIFITLVLAFIISLIIHFIAFDVINKKIANAKLSYPTTNIKKKPSPKKGFSNVKFVKLKKEVPKEKPIEQKKPTINQEVKKILEPIKKPIAKKALIFSGRLSKILNISSLEKGFTSFLF